MRPGRGTTAARRTRRFISAVGWNPIVVRMSEPFSVVNFVARCGAFPSQFHSRTEPCLGANSSALVLFSPFNLELKASGKDGAEGRVARGSESSSFGKQFAVDRVGNGLFHHSTHSDLLQIGGRSPTVKT